MNTERIHELFISGEKIKNIAVEFGVKESKIHNFIKKQREINPEKWPWRYGSNFNVSHVQPFHIYECPDCILTFAVEQAYEHQSDVCCPVCWSEDVDDVCSGVMKISREVNLMDPIAIYCLMALTAIITTAWHEAGKNDE